MEDIKEILGEDHVIYKINNTEIVDYEDQEDVLEKIESIIAIGINHDSKGINHDGIGISISHDDGKGTNNNDTKFGTVSVTKTEPITDADYELSLEELRFSRKNRSALPRILPEWHEINQKKVYQIIFGGCAGMYHYFLGIASVLQEKFDLSNVVFGAVSGGCFPALALILGMKIKDLHDTWNKEILRELDNSIFKAFSRLNGIVSDKSKKYLPPDAHTRAKNRLFISLTEFPSLNNHIVHSWQTVEDLLGCVQASCFIPIFDNKFWTIFDKVKYVDGGLSNNKPIPYPDMPYIYITTNRWREIPLHWYWCYTSETWSDQLYEWGRADTLEHIEEFDFLRGVTPRGVTPPL